MPLEKRIQQSQWAVDSEIMKATIERISAVTLKVADMENSVHFYQNVLGMDVLYGDASAGFTSLRIPNTEFSFINLQLGSPAIDWGRIIFHVSDVDAFWTCLKQNGFEPAHPQDAPWGERYFHMRDPDGHELSFAGLCRRGVGHVPAFALRRQAAALHVFRPDGHSAKRLH
jgi:catechol 2,3-dioxygenase-like lactoylglutathione lyase family enzyme